ncbi:exodeoxyribonuclease V subunit beta [Vibrio palustris]|uniref:RecBCD enzyme subunit RecB n=1 Tax=Vibrio palustris TaxID=1918946 RepID=A0A1R4AZU7_9VIBR|nr:exodeoxyribonuclease V subunit beta [Vibrio palustris]SJL82188.1 RecBCD enzyme subunit RecB [Vibrio palustris]
MTAVTQTIEPQTLDAMTFPLHGARLIEASAGTGKTFTIAALYLRLVLGHGDELSRHSTPLSVDQILVVTFTEAATAELRERIRTRIHTARIAFARGVSEDPVIAPLLEQFTDHRLAVQLLTEAERQMDEAAIYTIHGFCQRMLTQNAFESGSRFANEFVTDESHLKAQVVADYWRCQFYPLPLNLAAEVRRLWGRPDDLLQRIGRYLTGAPLTVTTPPLSDDLATLHANNLQRIDDLKQLWRAHEADLEGCISLSDVNKRSYSKKTLPQWLLSVSAWAASPTQNYEWPDKLEKFAQNTLIEKTPDGKAAPMHEVFAAIEAFLAEPISLEGPLLAHAIDACRTRLANLKQRKHWLSFDDLLTQLSAALDLDEQQVLAERIRHLYPVAMIDEFQDTDPLQYSIFSRIYLAHPHAGLFMIGDPKQAIYAFRGADIFTYIRARNQVSAHYTLGTNWRSSLDMVSGVNRLFTQAERPFIYDQDIPFYPVNPNPNADKKAWYLYDEKQPALTYWRPDTDGALMTKGEYLTQMATATAAHIQHVLTLAQNQKAYFSNGKPIEASNIAVLVRTGSEGRRIKTALSEQGIASVYLSNRDSVFATQVAMDVQRLLQAVLNPDNDRLLRASLASPLFALNAQQLDKLNWDENAWEKVSYEFKTYRQLWKERGVLPMLRAVLAQRHIAERWLEEPDGERALTDFMHIGELLQDANQDIDSDHGLLRWLSQTITDVAMGLGQHDEQIQRLESERNLVQIVTIHKSKGLEYDLVFLPFALGYRAASEGKYYDASTEKTMLDIMASGESLLQAEQERLAEDLRLAYVALTRAVYACFIGVAPLRNGRSTKEPSGVHDSAIGYLLQNGEQGGIALLHTSLDKAVQGINAQIVPPPELPEGIYVPESEAYDTLPVKSLQRPVDRRWRITSYSGLVKQGAHHSVGAEAEISGFDIDSAQDMEEASLLEPERSIFTFPRGAQPGTFLHSVFEQVIFTQAATTVDNTEVLENLLENEQYDAAWLPVLQKLVDDVLNVPLDGKQLRLSNKAPSQQLVEMEFLLPIRVLDAPSLNRITHRYDALSARAGALGFYPVHGMLKGFIDLVFEHEGKYYVLDWKSNHLGDDSSAYQEEALAVAMAEHRYDLQYQIYALALHRFLASRVQSYDYEKHFGGIYYVFLRGVNRQSKQGIFYTRPPQALISELDQLIDGRIVEHRETEQGQWELDL